MKATFELLLKGVRQINLNLVRFEAKSIYLITNNQRLETIYLHCCELKSVNMLIPKEWLLKHI